MYRTRTYEPEEVRRILRRAAELQDAEGAPAEGARPLTLEQIEQIAREAGIAEGLVRRAASGTEEPAPLAPAGGRSNVFLGGPSHLSLERKVVGRVGPSNHAQLVKVIRRALKNPGTSQVLGDSLTWSTTHWGPGGRNGVGRLVSVTLDPEADGVSIRIDESLRNLGGGLYGGLLGGGGGVMLGLIIPLAVAVFHSRTVALVGAVVWVVAVYALARAIYAGRVRARTAELSKLLDGLVDLVAGEPEKLPAAPSRVAAPGPRIEPVAGGRSDAAEPEDADAVEEKDASRRSGRRH